MADGIGTALNVVNTLFAALNNSQVKEILSTFNYKSDLKSLKNTVTTVSNLLLEADNQSRQRTLTNIEAGFIQKLKEALYDADDLFDKFVTLAEVKEQLRNGSGSKKVRHFFSSKNPLIVAWSMSQDVKKIRKKLNDTAEDHAKYQFNVDTQHLRTKRVETQSYVHVDNVIGREDDAREIIGRLLNSTADVGFLTIVGIGGLGKTTLAQLVFSDESIESQFEVSSWACVSDQDGAPLNVEKILSKILKSIDCQMDVNSSIEDVQREYQYNLKGKKFLLVLDDVWTENTLEWQALEKFLMLGGKGSRIIITSRSKKTASIIGTDIHELKGLSEENSWRLFEINAFKTGSKSPDFIRIGKEILGKCSNVPLAILVMGTLLNGQPLEDWKTINTCGFAALSERNNEITSILKLSYDHLEPSLKSCFSYCALFPKDYVIKKEMLMNLWEAQGYIVPFVEGQTIERAGDEHFSTLLQRCFFQDVKKNEFGEVETFKMHDLMHDLAQKVSGRNICIVNSNTPNMDFIVRHLFDNRLTQEGDFVVKSKIRSYLMFRKRRSIALGHELTTFLVRNTSNNWKLRALALQDLRFTSLPDTMGNLLHLRYLNLAKNSMEKLPGSIVRLHNLQTLNLNRCDELKEWPKDFSKLVNLKHLYREKCYALRCMPIGMSKLTRLRMLTDFVVEDESVSGMQHVGQLRDLKALAVNLNTRLSVHFYVNFTSSEGYNWEGSCLQGSEHLKELEICFSFPSPVLYQRRMDERRRVNDEAVMEKLRPHPNLIKFKLIHYAGDQITSWGRAQDNWAEINSLPKLVHIKLSDCHRLQQLPLLSTLLHLKSLSLFELKNLSYIEEEGTSHDGSGSTNTTFFPSLESLEILVLKNLRGWRRSCDDSQRYYQPAFPRLSQLTIDNCPHLISFPPCLSLPKLDLRNINKELTITTANGTHSSSSDPQNSTL